MELLDKTSVEIGEGPKDTKELWRWRKIEQAPTEKGKVVFGDSEEDLVAINFDTNFEDDELDILYEVESIFQTEFVEDSSKESDEEDYFPNIVLTRNITPSKFEAKMLSTYTSSVSW